MVDFLSGFLISALIGVMAYYKKSLRKSGVIAAILLGTFLFGFAGWHAFSVLIIFFLSSVVINRFDRKRQPSYRSYVQVFTNGGIAVIAAFIFWLDDDVRWLVLSYASIAISASDTWSSEIGRYSKHTPRHLLTMKPIGQLSGGVTLLGTFSGLVGALLFAVLSLGRLNVTYALLVFIIAFLGGIIDSLLGCIQVKYRHLDTGEIVETNTKNTAYYSGIKFLNNDLVNLLSNVIATGVLAMIIFLSAA